jgi:four helix bundle protein
MGKIVDEDIFNLENLDIWKKGRKFRKKISKLTKKFPEFEKYKLKDQMTRASRSFTANIAEGYGRFHYQENIQFCRQARASLFELFDHFTVTLDEGYINVEEFEEYKKQLFSLIKMVNGYIKYLNKRKTKGLTEETN